MTGEWQQKIEGYCEKYDIPILYLVDTLYEPKVVPMIRGKAFEFSVMLTLERILPKNERIRHYWRRFHVPYTILFFLVLLLHVLMKVHVFGGD